MTIDRSAAPGDTKPLEPHAFWSFAPDGANAARLAAEVDRRMVESLRYVLGEVAGTLALEGGGVEQWLARVDRAGRLHPMVHTLLHMLVAEIEAGNETEARAIAGRMMSLDTAPAALAILPLGPREDDPRPVRFASRFADLEEENRLDLIAPEETSVAPANRLIAQGLALVARNDPDLDAEFRALVREIWLAQQAPGHRFTTAAVSCFQNWGGLIVNPAVHHHPLDVVELAAHEATHLLLFALAMDEALLTNPPEERHHSPLREAPRSMDGVFHATIVAARVLRAMLRQADAEGRDSAIGREALARAAHCVRLFEEGLDIIGPAARMTPLGRRVLDDSKGFVAESKTRLAAPARAEAAALAADRA